MDIIFISIIAAIIFSSYYIFGWAYYIIVFVINICITFTIFKYYPLADGHGAAIVYLFFFLNVLILHLSIIPFLFIKKRKKILYWMTPIIVYFFESLSYFGMSSHTSKNLQVSFLLFLSFFPLHILFYIKNKHKIEENE